MALVVNTNVTALIAHRRLSTNATNVQKSMERLASGFRINRAADDAAGLTISETLITQIRGSKKALQNAQDGISILQIAEGSLTVITDNLQRMRELAVQAANDTNSQAQRDAIGREIRARAEDIDRIAQATNFNGLALLDGSLPNLPIPPRLQIGPNTTIATNTIDISRALASARIDANDPNGGLGVIDSAGADYTSLASFFDLATQTSLFLTDNTNANILIGRLDGAINRVTAQLSDIGSFQNQLESVVANLTAAVENFSASNSRIRDLDVAAESTVLVQNQILQQAAVAVLGQANNIPQLTLSLLQQ